MVIVRSDSLMHSDSGWSLGHHWAFYLCLDNLFGRALDCAHHWDCLVWCRVGLTPQPVLLPSNDVN